MEMDVREQAHIILDDFDEMVAFKCVRAMERLLKVDTTAMMRVRDYLDGLKAPEEMVEPLSAVLDFVEAAFLYHVTAADEAWGDDADILEAIEEYDCNRGALDRSRENRLRRWADRMGWKLMKSRARIVHDVDRGLWMLQDDTGAVVVGGKFDASIDDVERSLSLEQERLKGKMN